VATKLARVNARTAAEVAQHCDLSDDGRALFRTGMTPGEYLDALSGAGKHPDAVQFLAHALGKREAVWWACVCTRATIETSPEPSIVAALSAAEKWCYDPTEPHRRAAGAAAEPTKYEHPAGWAAVGAFWSGGSMAPPESTQPVPPGPHLTAKAVTSAVSLAAVRTAPDKAAAKFQDFLARGVDIANGGAGGGPPKVVV
jgi:hypothetical protein